MSVNWRHIHAVPMPTVLTHMAALTAYVGKALKEMGSTVQVWNKHFRQAHLHGNYVMSCCRYSRV